MHLYPNNPPWHRLSAVVAGLGSFCRLFVWVFRVRTMFRNGDSNDMYLGVSGSC